MIVKIQRPLYTPPGERPMWMVYNRSRKYSKFISTENIPTETLAEIGDDLKAYFVAVATGKTTLGFSHRVPDQDW